MKTKSSIQIQGNGNIVAGHDIYITNTYYTLTSSGQSLSSSHKYAMALLIEMDESEAKDLILSFLTRKDKS